MTPQIYPGLAGQPQQQFRLKVVYHLNDDKIGYVVAKVFDYLQIPHADIDSANRKREAVEARQIAMYIVRKHLGCTLRKIAAHFNRDHSSVIYSINTVNDLIDTDRAFKKKIIDIETSVFSQ